MNDTALDMEVKAAPTKKPAAALSAVSRILRYSLVRIVMLFITVVIGIYLCVLVANMGGYVDEIRRGAIREEVSVAIFADQSPDIKGLTSAQKKELIEGRVALEVKRLGLDKPFIIRSFIFLKDAMTLNLGFAEQMVSDSGSKSVKLILLERLPPTLVLWGAANLLLLDRITVALAPTSSAPGWFYGLFLILIFAAVLKVLPFGGMVDAPPPESKLMYALSLGKHLILPVSAVIIANVFLGAYNQRTFFLIYSQEDYVEMAKAKGLTDREIERKYILRPTLPTIITQFALTIITLWTGAPILETIFNWPGLGRALYRAIGLYDTPVIVGSQVIYAYLLAFTVFLLDFIYALVDPRVRVGAGGRKA